MLINEKEMEADISAKHLIFDDEDSRDSGFESHDSDTEVSLYFRLLLLSNF